MLFIKLHNNYAERDTTTTVILHSKYHSDFESYYKYLNKSVVIILAMVIQLFIVNK